LYNRDVYAQTKNHYFRFQSKPKLRRFGGSWLVIKPVLWR